MTTILVCGGRQFGATVWGKSKGQTEEEVKLINNTLDSYLMYPPLITRLISGGAPGADTVAANWAAKHEVPFHIETARWKLYGKRAGIVRNIRMLTEFEPEIVIAFPGGRGTAHMVGIAMKYGCKVHQVKLETATTSQPEFHQRPKGIARTARD